MLNKEVPSGDQTILKAFWIILVVRQDIRRDGQQLAILRYQEMEGISILRLQFLCRLQDLGLLTHQEGVIEPSLHIILNLGDL